MASSLAEQLGQLRSLNAARLTSSAQVRHAHAPTSYLYSTRDASRQDLRTAHAIAVNGWEEICLQDASISKWASSSSLASATVETLLGETSVTRDRTMLGKEENAQLDKYIDFWLQRMGAYLLDKNVSKCIEWLVRRFRVYEFNAQSLLSAFIPYHETPQFARILQITDLSKAPLLAAFLSPYKQQLKVTEGAQVPPLSLNSIIAGITKSLGTPTSTQLLSWLASLATPTVTDPAENLAPHRALLGFWTSSLVQFCVLCCSTASSSGGAPSIVFNGTKATSLLKPDVAQGCLGILLPAATNLSTRAARAASLMSESRRKRARSKATKEWAEARLAASMLLSAIAGCFDLSMQAAGAALSRFLSAEENADAAPLETLLSASSEEVTNTKPSRTDEAALLQSRATLAACYAICASVGAEGTATQKLFTPRVVASLLALPSLVKLVEQDMLKSDISAFLSAFLGKLAELTLEEHSSGKERKGISQEARQALSLRAKTALEPLLLSPHLSDVIRQGVVDKLVEAALPSAPSPSTSSAGPSAAKLLATQPSRVALLANLRQRYPRIFSSALEQFDARGESQQNAKGKGKTAAMSEHTSLLLNAVIAQSTLSQVPNAHTLSNDGTVQEQTWLALHSSEAHERAVALDDLLRMASNALTAGKDTSAIKALLLSRVEDSSFAVISKLYKQGGILSQIATPAEIADAVATSITNGSATVDPRVLDAHQTAVLQILADRDTSSAFARRVFLRNLLPTLLDVSSQAAATHRALAATSVPAQASGPWAQCIDALRSVASRGNTSDRTDAAARAIAARLKDLDHAQRRSCLEEFVKQAGNHTPAGAMSALVLLRHIQTLDLLKADVEEQEHAVTLWNQAFSICQHWCEKAAPITPLSEDLQDHYGAKWTTFDNRCRGAIGQGLFRALAQALPGAAKSLSERYYIGDTSVWNGMLQRSFAFLTSGVFEGPLLVELSCALYANLPGAMLASLAHIFTDTKATAATRFLAIQVVNHQLRRTTVDVQTIIPALLQAIAHPDQRFRKAALDCFKSIQSTKGLAREAKDASVYGFDSIYGPASSKLQYLLSEDVTVFVDAIISYNGEQGKLPSAGFLGDFASAYLATDKTHGRKEAAKRSALLCYLLSHVACWPASHSGRAVLLTALSPIHSSQKLQILLPPLQELIERFNHNALDSVPAHLQEEDQQCLSLFFNCFDRTVRSTLDEDSAAWRVLLSGINSPSDAVRAAASDAVVSIFSSVSNDMRLTLVKQLTAASVRFGESTSAPLARCLRKLSPDAQTLRSALGFFRADLTKEETNGEPAAKKSRRSDVNLSGAQPAALAMSILLAISFEQKVHLNSGLTSELFEDTRVIVDPKVTRFFNVEMALFHAIATLNKGLTVQAKPHHEIIQSIRVDALIAIINMPLSQSLLQNVLTLLATIAKLAPDQVVHNVMPIFTFVGSSVLARDDNASFAVVETTMRAIVPALTGSIRANSKDDSHLALLLRAREFLRIFTGAANHIPRHRRVAVFENLVQLLGPGEFLSAVMLQLVDRYISKILKASPAHARDGPLELPLSLLKHFDSDLRGQALHQCVEEALRLAAIQETDPVIASSAVFLDRIADSRSEHGAPMQNGPKQATAILAFIATAVESIDLNERDLRQLAKEAIACLRVQDARLEAAGSRLLESSVDALSDTAFASFIIGPMSDPSDADLAVRLLHKRSQRLEPTGRASLSPHMGKIIDALLLAMKDGDVTISTAAMSNLSEQIQDTEVAKWSETIPRLLAITDVNASAIYKVIASIIPSLGPRLIPQINLLVSHCQKALSHDAAIQANVFQILANMVKGSPNFMANHLLDLLTICIDTSGSPVSASPAALVTSILRNCDTEAVLTNLSSLWDLKQTQVVSPLCAILDLLRRVLAKCDRSQIVGIYKSVFRFLLKTFDYRRLFKEQATAADVRKVEDTAGRAFLQLVLKLNENTFRPLFLRFYDWAAVDLVEEEVALQSPEIVSRTTTFYRIFNAMQDQLKGLISGYYATVFGFSMEAMGARKERTVLDNELWLQVMESLKTNALFDEGVFWNSARANRAINNITQSLDMAGEGDAPDNLAEEAASVICSVVQSAQEDGVMKATNKLLLTKTKSDTPEVVLAALASLERFWTTFADSLLTLVPETAPSISELMNSADPDVVASTQSLIKAIEQVLGEPLDQYIG